MSESIISWNFTNWITVVLMALIMFTVVGLLMKVVQKRSNSNATA